MWYSEFGDVCSLNKPEIMTELPIYMYMYLSLWVRYLERVVETFCVVQNKAKRHTDRFIV